MSASAKLNQINIVVSNLDASITFYGRLGLGFTVDPAYATHAQCELADGTVVALDSEAAVAQFTAGWTPPAGGPRVAFGFGLPSADAVDALYAELIADGIPADLQAAL